MINDFVKPYQRLKKPSIWHRDITNEYVDIVLSTIMIALVMFSASATVGFYQNVLNNL